MLSFSNVSAGYGGVPVLKEIGFQVADGEMVAIFGHNGAGKTTLMRCAVGDMTDVSGEITWQGHAIVPKAVFRNVRLGIGFVPQGHNVFRELTVRRNLLIAGLHHPDVDVESIYSLFPILKQRGAQMAGSLSGGQQQILALGMALMTKPSILLLDEPSTGLAPVW
jgi:branched-chain amino acid transport system ATP-binding protein